MDEYYKIINNEKNKLPIDNNGCCIFHSSNVSWKVNYDFSLYLNKILELILRVDNGTIILDSSNGFIEFDLRGITYIGEEYELYDKKVVRLVEFKELIILNDIFVSMDDSRFVDILKIENCNLSKSDFDFKNSIFEKEVSISNTQIKQISFDNSKLEEGIYIDKCDFNGYCEFCNMKVKGTFSIVNSYFKSSTFFIESIYDTDAWDLDNNHFEDLVDFSKCDFVNEISLENCTFLRELRFTDSKFNKSVVFNFNVFEGNVFIN